MLCISLDLFIYKFMIISNNLDGNRNNVLYYFLPSTFNFLFFYNTTPLGALFYCF